MLAFRSSSIQPVSLGEAHELVKSELMGGKARKRCTVTLNSVGSPTNERWYALWRYAVAIKQLCVNAGRPGIASVGMYGSVTPYWPF